MAEAVILSPIALCNSFPKTVEPEIFRHLIIDTFLKIFEKGIELIVVEGDEGIGKTVIMSQFARKYSDVTLSLFIRSTSKMAYDPDLHRIDLARQINFILCNEDKDDYDLINEAHLRRLFFELQKFARVNNKSIYFVIDGLDEIPKGEEYAVDAIINMLPLGYGSNFYFLVSGDLNLIKNKVGQGVKNYPNFLPQFSPEETNEYLKDLNLDEVVCNELERTCRGVPGKLASIRRLIESGQNVATLLDDLDSKLPNLFEVEWRRVDISNGQLVLLLALVAMANRQLHLSDYSRMLGGKPEEIEKIVDDLKFIEVNDAELEYVSESFKKFALARLNHLRPKVSEILIKDLIAVPDSQEALEYLPKLYKAAGKLDDLLNFLTTDNMTHILKKSQSFLPILNNTVAGIEAAKELSKTIEVVNFSFQKSSILEICSAQVWRSEIEARLSLKDYESALALAQSNTLVEDRLHALAVVAKYVTENNLVDDKEVASNIKMLFEQIDISALGERAIEIATDLIHYSPEMAMELVEKSTVKKKGKNALNHAFTKLTLATLDSDGENTDDSDVFDKLHSKVDDPATDRFLTGVAILVGKYSATKVIEESNKITTPADRIFLLRQWTTVNHKRSDAYEVVDYALSLIIKTTSYCPNAQDFKDLAMPLPHISDPEKVKELIVIFDSQKETVEKLGPTYPYVSLELLIAKAISKYSPITMASRIADIYCYASYIEDVVIKGSCLSSILKVINDLSSQKLFDDHELKDVVEQELKDCCKQILRSTAGHKKATEKIIKLLGPSYTEEMLKLSLSLNTEKRRNAALYDLALTILNKEKSPFEKINKISGQITITYVKHDLVVEIFNWLNDVKQRTDEYLSFALEYVGKIDGMPILGEKCRAYCNAYNFFKKQGEDYDTLANSILVKLKKSWVSVDVEWHKVDIGFKVVKELSHSNIDEANWFFQKNTEFRAGILLDTKSIGSMYLGYMRLLIRAFTGLLRKHLDGESCIKEFESLLSRVRSFGQRAVIWSELALVLFRNDRISDFKAVLSDYLIPCINNISDDDRFFKDNVIVAVSPSLYCHHKNTCLGLIKSLSDEDYDSAINRIVHFVQTKQSPSDPYDTSGKPILNMDFTEILDIIELMSTVRLDDGMIYSFIYTLTDWLTAKKTRRVISSNQIAQIVVLLEKLVEQKLPNARGISHDGYKLISIAQINRLKSNKVVWDTLIAGTDDIPNLSDKILILGTIAVAMRSKDREKSLKLQQEALDSIGNLPSYLDKTDRLETLANITSETDSSFCKKCISLAFQLTAEAKDDDLDIAQKRLVDIAYRIDPAYANALTDLLDNDPARAANKLQIKTYLETLRIKGEIVNERNSKLDISKLNRYVDAAGMLLGSLNANKLAPLPFVQLSEYVDASSYLPFSQAYIIYSFILESAVRRLGNTDEAVTMLKPLYTSVFNATELTGSLILKTKSDIDTTIAQVLPICDSSKVIKPGDRDKAVEFILNWVENEKISVLKIADPYFCLEDLEIVKLIQSKIFGIRIEILTSLQQHRNERIDLPYCESYKAHWRSIASNPPPSTRIVIIGISGSGDSPIHDRWWLSENTGLRLGTSFNSLGVGKYSEVSVMTADETKPLLSEVNQYLSAQRWEYNNQSLAYDMFIL